MSSDKYANMIRMANQIATYFQAYPHDEALAGVVSHLERFWERRMRQHLHEYVDAGHTGLHPLVIEAEKLIERPHAPLAVAHSAAESKDGAED